MKVILWIMDQCDTKIDFIKYMWVSDLFRGPVILLNILRLFDGGILYLG